MTGGCVWATVYILIEPPTVCSNWVLCKLICECLYGEQQREVAIVWCISYTWELAIAEAWLTKKIHQTYILWWKGLYWSIDQEGWGGWGWRRAKCLVHHELGYRVRRKGVCLYMHASCTWWLWHSPPDTFSGPTQPYNICNLCCMASGRLTLCRSAMKLWLLWAP